MPSRIIHIQPDAPPKPRPTQPCNGCGVCCLYEPCPLGRLLSRRRQGACVALRWNGATGQYRCGAVVLPQEVLRAALPAVLRWLAPVATPGLSRLAARWIAAGQGCDCSLEVIPPEKRDETDRQSMP